jgi:hypothetical protein
MYAQLANSQLTSYTDGHTLTLPDGRAVSNPTSAMLAAQGYYAVLFQKGSHCIGTHE